MFNKYIIHKTDINENYKQETTIVNLTFTYLNISVQEVLREKEEQAVTDTLD